MNELIRKEPVRREMIDESRAASLLGLPREQLRQICEFSGLGRRQEGMDTGNLFFTYEELYRLCRLVVGPAA
jgi:hypothetical protein